MSRFMGRSTKYYVLDKETGVIDKLSLYGKHDKKGKLVYAKKAIATGFRFNEKLQRLERLHGVKVKQSKKDRRRERR